MLCRREVCASIGADGHYAEDSLPAQPRPAGPGSVGGGGRQITMMATKVARILTGVLSLGQPVYLSAAQADRIRPAAASTTGDGCSEIQEARRLVP